MNKTHLNETNKQTNQAIIGFDSRNQFMSQAWAKLFHAVQMIHLFHESTLHFCDISDTKNSMCVMCECFIYPCISGIYRRMLHIMALDRVLLGQILTAEGVTKVICATSL